MAEKFHVVVVGGGGRETAIVKKLVQTSEDVTVTVFGGLSGMLYLLNEDQGSRVLIGDGKATDLKTIKELCLDELPDLVIFGPESPLIQGGADLLSEICPVFGFSQKGARLEGEKIFAKKAYEKLGYPTAAATYVRNVDHGKRVLEKARLEGRLKVLKSNREAGGKGVIVTPLDHPAHWEEQARQLELMMTPTKPLGFYAPEVLIEERYAELNEWSAMSIVGPNEFWLPLMPTKDHKLFNGLNSGGMGTVTPAPGFSMADMGTRKEVVQALQQYLLMRFGTDLAGILYEGLNRMGMVDYLVEINVRGGDPETQAQLDYILGVAFHELLLAAVEGNTGILKKVQIPENLVEVGVVMASRGYPGDYSAVQGKEIWIPEQDELPENGWIVPSGLVWEDGKFYIKGSRVLMAFGSSTNPDYARAVEEAREIAYQIIELIEEKDTGLFLDYRIDIGQLG